MRYDMFLNSKEVAAAIRAVSVELTDVLMVALGSLFESFSGEEAKAIGDMYTALPYEAPMADAVKEVSKVPLTSAKQDSQGQ